MNFIEKLILKSRNSVVAEQIHSKSQKNTKYKSEFSHQCPTHKAHKSKQPKVHTLKRAARNSSLGTLSVSFILKTKKWGVKLPLF